MIKPGEIQIKAHQSGVRDQQIEKDYVLSWILQGIAQHNVLSKVLVFKGGTVLKKVYFRDYRFSEDLDFTLLNDDVSNQQFSKWFSEIFEYVIEEANIPLQIVDNNEHEDGGINFYISFTGPLGGLGANKKVKVDISRDEVLAFLPVQKNLFKEYSDISICPILCYSLEEVLVEKMRSVMQRMQARDFYDIWYLLEKNGMLAHNYLNEFSLKCESKGLKATNFAEKLEQRIPQYKARWQKSMGEQIHKLPDFDQMSREVMRHLKKMINEM